MAQCHKIQIFPQFATALIHRLMLQVNFASFKHLIAFKKTETAGIYPIVSFIFTLVKPWYKCSELTDLYERCIFIHKKSYPVFKHWIPLLSPNGYSCND